MKINKKVIIKEWKRWMKSFLLSRRESFNLLKNEGSVNGNRNKAFTVDKSFYLIFTFIKALLKSI